MALKKLERVAAISGNCIATSSGITRLRRSRLRRKEKASSSRRAARTEHAGHVTQGKSDGEEDDEVATVDERRHWHTEDARAREDPDNRDRPQAEAHFASDAAKSIHARCEAIRNFFTEEKYIVSECPDTPEKKPADKGAQC